MATKTNMLEGNVPTVLRQMAVPMGVGLVFMILVNIIDTYWVGRLGTQELAAMTFTFPVIGFISNLSFGLMIGATTAIARTIGGGDAALVRKIVTHSMILGVAMVIVVTALGIFSQKAIFQVLGADEVILPMVLEYMTIWYFGSIFLIIPLLGNATLRASGDAKTPMIMMVIVAIVNAILDPILIFGWWGFPQLGIAGAAYATLTARFVGLIFIFGILHFREKLLDFHIPSRSELVDSWKKILSVGIPAMITNAMGPLAVAALTSLVALQGAEALAAYGIGARVDALLLIAPSSFSAALSPFIGQNFGAHLGDRVSKGVHFTLRFAILWGLGVLLILLFTARPMASFFSDDPKVIEALVIYLSVIPIGYAAVSVVRVASSAFNAMDRAFRSTILSLLQSLIIAIPGAYIGSIFLGLNGIFLGLVVASLCSSILGVTWLRILVDENKEARAEVSQPISVSEAAQLMATPDIAKQLEQLLPDILGLEDLEVHKVRSNSVGFFVGDRELAHSHNDGRIDLPLPFEVGENLIRLNVVEHHPLHDNGWYTHSITNTEEVKQTIWLLFLAHSLYEISKRGADHEITKAEMDTLCISEQCRQSIISSALRWNVSVAS